MNLFRKKSISALLAQSEQKEASLKKELGAFDLTMLGIGAIIGTGIFVLTGVAAAGHAGPALVLSFILSGLAVYLQHYVILNFHLLYRYPVVLTLIAMQHLEN